MPKLKLNREEWSLVVICFFGTFTAFFNQTTVTPALPTIMNDFSIDAATAQWLLSAYTLVLAITVPVNAFLLEKFSAKRIFLFAMGIYTVGCVLTGAGSTFNRVLIGRITQGTGNGLLMPTTMSVLLYIFPKENRGKAMGFYGLLISLAPILGPTVSGLVVDNLSWHWIYFGVAIISFACFVTALVIMPETYVAEKTSRKLDFISLITSIIGFGAILIGFSTLHWLPFVVGIPIAAYFVYRQFKIKNPMLNLRILKSKQYGSSVIIFNILQATIIGSIVLYPMMIQNEMGYSATVSGLSMLPCDIIIAFMNPLTGQIFDKHGIRGLGIWGSLLLVISGVLLSFLGLYTSLLFFIIALVIRGAGLSCCLMNMNTWGINSLSKKDIPHASSVSNTTRMMSVAFGVAIFSAIYENIGGLNGLVCCFVVQAIACAVAFVLTFIFAKDK